MASAPATNTANRILDIAERLVQSHGFNGFSYADISTEMRIKKASLHHHFRTKAMLGTTLVARYRETFVGTLAQIDRETSQPMVKLDRYAHIYRGVLLEHRMCLCGMLAAEFETLPRSMRSGVHDFFNANEAWLAQVLTAGRRTRALYFKEAPLVVARSLVSSLEGAMLVARAYGDVKRFDAVTGRLLAELAARS